MRKPLPVKTFLYAAIGCAAASVIMMCVSPSGSSINGTTTGMVNLFMSRDAESGFGSIAFAIMAAGCIIVYAQLLIAETKQQESR